MDDNVKKVAELERLIGQGVYNIIYLLVNNIYRL